MDQFPASFTAPRVHHIVTLKRGQKVDADAKGLRESIVRAFADIDSYEREVVYRFQNQAASHAQQVACYKTVKHELQQLGFTVHGRIIDGVATVTVSVEKPRVTDHLRAAQRRRFSKAAPAPTSNAIAAARRKRASTVRTPKPERKAGKPRPKVSTATFVRPTPPAPATSPDTPKSVPRKKSDAPLSLLRNQSDAPLSLPRNQSDAPLSLPLSVSDDIADLISDDQLDLSTLQFTDMTDEKNKT